MAKSSQVEFVSIGPIDGPMRFRWAWVSMKPGVTVAMTNKVGLGKIASVIHPYPTQAEAIRKLGDQFNRTKLTPFSQRILNVLRRINVGA